MPQSYHIFFGLSAAAAFVAHQRWAIGLPMSLVGAFLLTHFLLDPGYIFIQNLITAYRIGLPMAFLPLIDQNSIFWLIFSLQLRDTFRKWLPRPLWHNIRVTIYGWQFHEPTEPFDQLGSSFVLVSSGHFEVWSRDPEVIIQLSSQQNFRPTDQTRKILGPFGPNVFTVVGDDWTRQRRVIAGSINDRVSRAVWSESIKQSEGMLGDIFKSGGAAAESNKAFDSFKTIARNVLSGVTMGAPVPWTTARIGAEDNGFHFTYTEAIQLMIDGVVGPNLFPRWFLRGYPSFLPGASFLHNLAIATDEFPRHIETLSEKERQRQKHTDGEEASRSSILAQLTADSFKGGALTKEEVCGNMFVFVAAGMDTTAGSLGYALALLARHPSWQDWLWEEVSSLTSNAELALSSPENFTHVYPYAVRIHALQLETLRLFPPVISLYRENCSGQALRTSDGNSYHFPQKTRFYGAITSMHKNPAAFRNLNQDQTPSDDDELQFRPSRWIDPKDGKITQQVPKGYYLPWSLGPRICPGMKMAQVEFSAVMLALIKSVRIEAVKLKGESDRDVEVRLDKTMANSMSVLSLQMQDVYNVKQDGEGLALRFRRRPLKRR